MKKFLIALSAFVIICFLYEYLFFYKGILYIPSSKDVAAFSKAEDGKLLINEGDGFTIFEIRGVNLGLGKPGKYGTEFAITTEEYAKWFQEIQAMGANVIRVYTLAHADFYDAFYAYNLDNPDPIYLIHGVWVDDYMTNSSAHAFDKDIYEAFLKNCKAVVDAVHGRYKTTALQALGTQEYRKDISPWVYGYILGVEWEDTLVGYTDYFVEDLPDYKGTYFDTEDGSNFEIFLAMIGDALVDYETKKYGQQKALAFSNWAITDPFDYPEKMKHYFAKTAIIDVEHIKPTDAFVAGYFASYHSYPYYPNYHSFYENPVENTYLQYLTALNVHHTIPVLISEFGVPSSRGMAAYEENLGRNQGFMSETEQGNAIISMYKDIKTAGSAGGIVFSWQDEWFKRTWNTMANTDLNSTPFWSDYQTNGQNFGLLSFDTGDGESICYVDGVRAEWTADDIVAVQGDARLSLKYDEKFIYFLMEKNGFTLERDTVYIPIDTTPKSGSTTAEDINISMSAQADFIIEIDGEDNSRLWVHERYNTANALYWDEIHLPTPETPETPKKDSTVFQHIMQLLSNDSFYRKEEASGDYTPIDFAEYDRYSAENSFGMLQTHETGKLTYGNANPNATAFHSLADFSSGEGFVEIKIPWGLLNFADPSQMNIHDDYYENYGVEYIKIDHMNVGVGDGADVIEMVPFALNPLGRTPEYHERLKESYYILKDYWTHY